MLTLLSRYEPQLYAVLRCAAGFLFLWHGSQKLFDVPPAAHPFAPHVLWIAGPIEFFGGLLILLGLRTREAAFLASGEMAYAYWTVHAPQNMLPLLNMGELAVVYCFLFLYMVARGSGSYSLDALLKRR
ncbi:MAG: DoxX family protein [Acidobacteriota bacterium]